MSADSGKYKAAARVEEKPTQLVLEFTPEKDATINLICDRSVLGSFLKVKAGVPVKAVATISPRDEWK